MFKLNANSDADSFLCLLSHFKCDGHTVHILTQWCPPPPLTSTLQSSLFTHVHSSPLSLAARLHWCCTVILTMVGLFPDRPHMQRNIVQWTEWPWNVIRGWGGVKGLLKLDYWEVVVIKEWDAWNWDIEVAGNDKVKGSGRGRERDKVTEGEEFEELRGPDVIYWIWNHW